MLIDIPEEYVEDFMQMLVEKMHDLQLDLTNAREDVFNWTAKYQKAQLELDELKEKKKK